MAIRQISTIDRIRAWCRQHNIPYIHGCIWDRECRNHGAAARITLIAGRHTMWIDLPGYWLDYEPTPDGSHLIRRRSWHWPHVSTYSQPRDDLT